MLSSPNSSRVLNISMTCSLLGKEQIWLNINNSVLYRQCWWWKKKFGMKTAQNILNLLFKTNNDHFNFHNWCLKFQLNQIKKFPLTLIYCFLNIFILPIKIILRLDSRQHDTDCQGWNFVEESRNLEQLWAGKTDDQLSAVDELNREKLIFVA